MTPQTSGTQQQNLIVGPSLLRKTYKSKTLKICGTDIFIKTKPPEQSYSMSAKHLSER